jgi:GNAT superfamily N-acetyltransferase
VTEHSIRRVGAADLDELLPLIRSSRIGVMNDLFVAERARGQGVAENLIEACRAQCVRRGARRLTWQTAPDNHRAQAVYDQLGATREQWIDYWLAC